jgi:hypothetical protein
MIGLARGKTGAILTLVSAALALIVALAVIMAGLSAWRVGQVERSWAATLGTRESILRRFPPSDADPAALELERLAAAIGIDLTPRTGTARARPGREQALAYSRAKTELGPYLNRQLGRTERAIDPPPAYVQTFIETHAAAIEAVRAQLESGRVPHWEMHIERGAQAPIPNLLGHIDLQKLLAVDALARLRAGDRETALRDLEAGWTLLRSLADSPLLICQLIAMSDGRIIAGLLRQVPEVPATWHARLREHDFRGPFLTALKYEGWHWTQWDRHVETAGLRAIAQRALVRLGRPYIDYCTADVSDRFRERLENLERVAALCDYDLAAHDASLDLPVPRWNVVGRLVMPHLGGALDRLARLELDVELTRLLFDLEAVRAAQGAWPTALPGGGVSSACPRDRWTYSRAVDGGPTVALDREIDWGPDVRGAILPTRFRIAASQEGV